MIKLRFRKGDKVLFEKVLTDFPCMVGRDPVCQIELGEAGISSKHCELDWDGYWLTLTDLKSTNGTYLGKEKLVGPKRIQLPCSVLLGNVVTLDMEAVVETAVANVKAFAPKPMKRPEVLAPLPTMEAPVPAHIVVLDDTEVIEGWQYYWALLKKVPPRPVLLLMIGLAFLYGFLHYLVFRESFFYSLANGFGVAAASAVLALILAGPLALLGLLFRGTYDFKPLFIQQCVGAMLMAIQIAILRPAMLMDYFGFVAQLLSVPIILVCSMVGTYVFFFNSFPHKRGKLLLGLAVGIALCTSAVEILQVFKVDKQVLLRDAMMGEYRSARGLAGAHVEVKDVTDDIREFGRQFTPSNNSSNR